MLIEYLSFIVTFLVTAGLAVIGILVSFQLYQQNKQSVFLILLYQQIFLISFFLYGIWGNIALHQIIVDLELNAVLAAKLAIFIPMMGFPFLVISWFMLLKFGFNINGYRVTNRFIYTYSISFVLLITLLIVCIQQGFIAIPNDADLFIIRLIVLFNLVMHFVLIFPFLKPVKNENLLHETKFGKFSWLIYLSGVLIYSATAIFFNLFGFVSTCISILLLFGVSIFIPLKIRLKIMNEQPQEIINIDFDSFCTLYEISKRETEIIREICAGKSNKAIAEKLFITLQTVKDHTHHIYTKTGVNSRIQLANMVREKTGVHDF